MASRLFTTNFVDHLVYLLINYIQLYIYGSLKVDVINNELDKMKIVFNCCTGVDG